ncbi:cRISPR-associated endoribonuclease Cas2 [Enterococcus columbae DSM 7374 = ATCC 51263]|nr:cRISPR-associated endoribonuclease Cas2 [Enterococcus columbae DSM 7374 = ATCC 51263]
MTPAEYVEIKEKLFEIIDKSTDSIRFYNLGKNWQHRVEKMGFDDTYDPDKDLLIF